jgi:hypothetical protein
LVDAYATHLTDASRMLQQLQERLTEVEQADDQITKRQVIEMLVHSIRIDTQDGAPGGSTPFTVTVQYAFNADRVAFNGNDRIATLWDRPWWWRLRCIALCTTRPTSHYFALSSYVEGFHVRFGGVETRATPVFIRMTFSSARHARIEPIAAISGALVSPKVCPKRC